MGSNWKTLLVCW